MNYIKKLDTLRFYAAFSVMIAHFFDKYRVNLVGFEYFFYQKVSEISQHGVTFFFVLSGFLITKILWSSKSAQNYFSSFYFRRLLRIFPLYYIALVFYYYALPPLLGDDFVSFSKQIPYYFYLQSLGPLVNFEMEGPGHFWTLAIEEHFYLFWPILIFLFSNKKDVEKFILYSIGLIFFLKFFMLSKNLDINHFTFTRIEQLMIGGLLGLKTFEKINKSFLKLILTTILIFVIFYLQTLQLDDNIMLFINALKHTLLALFFFYLLAFLLQTDKNIILDNKIFRYFGKISYGVYVYHLGVLMFVYEYIWNWGGVVSFLVYFVLTIVISVISFEFFETYFLAKKDNFKLKLK